MKLDFCVACGTKENLHHHHLLPKSRGGNDDDSNLITVCQHHHAIIHNTKWNGNLSELIKAGLQRAREIRNFSKRKVICPSASLLHVDVSLQRWSPVHPATYVRTWEFGSLEYMSSAS